MSADGSPELVKSVVLFADVLAVKEMALSPNSRAYMRRLSSSLKEATGYCSGSANFPWNTFSDCIAIGTPLYEGSAGLLAVQEMIRLAGTLQYRFAKCGLYLRGGITVGDFHIGRDFVYGEALVRSYLLETEKAGAPRILIDDDCRSLMNAVLDPRLAVTVKNSLLLDEDGLVFVNFPPIGIKADWGIAGHIRLSELNAKLKNAKDSQIVEESAESERILFKLKWVHDLYAFTAANSRWAKKPFRGERFRAPDRKHLEDLMNRRLIQ